MTTMRDVLRSIAERTYFGTLGAAQLSRRAHTQLVQQVDPEDDACYVRALLDCVRAFVAHGSYLHEGQNLCWFCDRGIAEWPLPGASHPINEEENGHDSSCLYLQAWRMVNKE